MNETARPSKARAGTDIAGSKGVRRFHQIYRPGDLHQAISQLRGTAMSDRSVDDQTEDGSWRSEAETPALSSEDAIRLRALERIAADPRGHRRNSIIGTPGMVRRLEILSASVPHFSSAVDLIARAALVSARTATSLQLPPILLVGEPGIGKTYTLRRVAEALGADFFLIAANITDAFRLRGMNTAWRGARPGRVAEILLGASTAPVVLVDEFDKAVSDRIERPYDVWHSLLERENLFKDDFLEFEMRADSISWIASANDISQLPPSILDRLLILEVERPSRDQIATIIASIYADCRSRYDGALSEQLFPDVLSELLPHNPRRIARILDLAVGYSAANGRRYLSVEDVRRADHLARGGRDASAGFRGPVGFTPNRVP